MTIGTAGAAHGFAENTLILASASPRRRALLAQIGVIPQAIRPADIDETPGQDELPRPYARRMASEKSAAIADSKRSGVSLVERSSASRMHSTSRTGRGQSNGSSERGVAQMSSGAAELVSDRRSGDMIAAADAVAGNTDDAYILAADTVVSLGRRILGKPRDAAEAARFLMLLSGRRHRVTTAISLRQGARTACRIVETRVKVKRLSDHEISAYLRSDEWRGKAGGYAIQGLFGAFIPEIHGSYTNVVGLPLTETAALLTGMGYPVPYEPAA